MHLGMGWSHYNTSVQAGRMASTHDEVVAWFKFYPSKDLAIVALALFVFFSMTVLAMTIKTRACKSPSPSHSTPLVTFSTSSVH